MPTSKIFYGGVGFLVSLVHSKKLKFCLHLFTLECKRYFENAKSVKLKGIVYPKMRNVSLFTQHGPSQVIHSSWLPSYENKKSIYRQHKINTPEDILLSYEVNQLVCARN